VTFEDHPPNLLKVVYRVLSSFHWKQAAPISHIYKAVDYNLPAGYTLACFDGAAQSGSCGAGGIFKSHHSRVTKWYFSGGLGTNTKAELLGLWTSLFLAASWSITNLLVLGDSRVVIDWINKKSNLRSVHIENWKHNTLELTKSFVDVKFLHFPRAHNGEADALSKRALKEVPGRLAIYHCENGIDSPSTLLCIF
jgi:ribonuclease HI